MSTGSPPSTDFQNAAEMQAGASRDVVNAQTQANRPNISTPWGTLNWNQVQNPGVLNPERQQLEQQLAQYPTSGPLSLHRRAIEQRIATMPEYTTAPSTSWDMDVQLTPEQQEALSAQNRIQAGRSGVAENLLGQAGQDVSQGFDWSSLGQMGTGDEARQQAIDAAYGQASSRLDPQWAQREEAQRTQLLNQGLTPGTEAYDTALATLGRQRNDAYTSAMNAAIGQGTSAGQAAFQQNLASRQQRIGEGQQRQYGTLNALNALLAGQQVSMPTFPGFSQAGASQAPQYLNAANMQYQTDLNRYGANQAGLQGLLSGGMGLLGLPF